MFAGIRHRWDHPRYWLLALTIGLLPLSYVPLELTDGRRLDVTEAVFLLVIVSAVRYDAIRRFGGAADIVLCGLVGYVGIRLTVLSALEGSGIDLMNAFSVVGTIASAIVLFRLGQVEAARITIKRSLQVLLVVLALWAVYQQVAGLEWLRDHGYREGFYFATEGGRYRPFGPFLAPTVFGGFLSVLGSAVILMAKRIWSMAVWTLLTIVPIVLTETRAAWIAFAVALGVGAFLRFRPRIRTLVMMVTGVAAVLALACVVMPNLAFRLFGRFLTLFDPSYTSNSSRIELWTSTIEAMPESPWIGFGARTFYEVMLPRIGDFYASYGHPHSTWMAVLFTLGLIGLIGFVIAVALAARGAVLHAQFLPGQLGGAAASAALTAFAVEGLVATTWGSFAFISLTFLVAGYGYADRGTLRRSGWPVPHLTPSPHELQRDTTVS